MKRQKVGSFTKINSHTNLLAEAICSGLANFGGEKTCNFLKAIFILPQVLKKAKQKIHHKTETKPCTKNPTKPIKEIRRKI